MRKMRKDTIEQLKSMYQNVKKREEEWKIQFPESSYQRGYAHGIATAYESMFEELCVFEKANMFDD